MSALIHRKKKHSNFIAIIWREVEALEEQQQIYVYPYRERGEFKHPPLTKLDPISRPKFFNRASRLSRFLNLLPPPVICCLKSSPPFQQ
ncbi:hypothetical protein CEXT_651031 [Caerostris extrusa]|uniref:Ycf15 n=1 Tax=Caerostris extrusa TaxID=172846 RepID=A0AAV4Y0N5_CAEEX|nr:hypothetical protein CEXT_651031 [Caerostris extrusa]